MNKANYNLIRETKIRLFLVLFFSSVFLLFNSCKKDVLNTTISGVVTDFKTGQPIANIKVELVELKVYTLNILGGVSTPDTLDRFTTYTDSEGKYSFKQRLSKNKKANDKNAFFYPPIINYTLYINTDNYYISDKRVNGASGNKKKFEINLELVPHTFIKYKYKNVNPYNDSDELRISTMSGNLVIKGKNIEGYTAPVLLGYQNDVNFSETIVSWDVWKENQIVIVSPVYFYVDTKYYNGVANCSMGDTVVYEINY